MSKKDFSKIYKNYYTAGKQPERVLIGPAVYISIAGQGDPSGPAFACRLEALYTVAYILKFCYKAKGEDFVVPKLEGLWWYDEAAYAHIRMSEAPTSIPREVWQYLLLLRMPENISREVLEQAVATAMERKDLPLLPEVQLHRMEEGPCIQVLHTGPFEREPETLALLQEYMWDHSLCQNGLHHEIYLSDFRRTAPEKLRTILREPIRQPAATKRLRGAGNEFQLQGQTG